MKQNNLKWFEVLDLLRESQAFPALVHRILLFGEKGTGKTSYTFRAYAPQLVESVNCTLDMMRYDLLGNTSFKQSKAGTKTIHVPEAAVRAFTKGKILILNEIDKMSTDITSIVHALLDDRTIARLSLPDGSTVTPHQNYGVIATMNPTPNVLPDTVLDRFDLILPCNVPAPGILLEFPPEFAELIANHYGRKTMETWQNPEISVRNVQSFLKLRQALGDEVAARIKFNNANAQEVLNILAVAKE